MADINLTAEQVAALILSIGDKSKLKTEEKQTLVDAINNVLDMRVNPERLSDLMRQFEAQLSNIYDSDMPAVPYVDNFTKLPIQTLAVERTAHEQGEADGQEINVLKVPSIGKMREEIKSPLYIRGTYDTQANTFTPDVDYTMQEILDAVSAGRYVALVVVIGNSTDHYIVPCTDYTPSSVGFSFLLIFDILDIANNHTNIRISRQSGGWVVAAFQTI